MCRWSGCKTARDNCPIDVLVEIIVQDWVREGRQEGRQAGSCAGAGASEQVDGTLLVTFAVLTMQGCAEQGLPVGAMHWPAVYVKLALLHGTTKMLVFFINSTHQ